MKQIILAFSLLSVLASCTHPAQPTPIAIEVEVEGVDNGKLYLCEIQNIQYGSARVIDTLIVENGHVVYTNDTLLTGLYAFTNQINRDYGIPMIEGNFFLQPGTNRFHYTVAGEKQQTVVMETLDLQSRYEAFLQHLKEINTSTDSVDMLFYAARDRGDREEMARLKEVSLPYYEAASQQKSAYIDSLLSQEKGSTFGLYLLYAYRFQNRMFNSMQEIDSVRTLTASYVEEARQSEFGKRIRETLKRFETCAIGNQAPDIEGVTPKGEPVRLSDFRGKLVLVDFWSSGCGWCRKENVYLHPAYEKYQDKGFTILGVSSDYRKEDWLRAIEEDQSYWNQLLMPREAINKVFDQYCISGIPHIILVSPEGVILEKELRGEAIGQAIAKHLNQPTEK